MPVLRPVGPVEVAERRGGAAAFLGEGSRVVAARACHGGSVRTRSLWG